MDSSHGLPDADMRGLTRHQVAGSGRSAASQVPYRLEPFQEPLPCLRPLQPAAVP
jgi:hypothetical protein